MKIPILLLSAFFILTACQSETTTRIETDLEPSPVRTAVMTSDIPQPDSTTRRLFEEVMAYARAENLHERPFGEIMQTIGLRFEGTPYVTGMLDEPEEETLIVNLTGFDCVLFIETVLALAQGIAQEDYAYATFADNVRALRYRDGVMNGYCSRLHYFSEWIADNENDGTIENLTDDLGGRLLDTQLTFMSEHRDAYPRLAENDSLFQGIQEMEADLAHLDIYYIPQDQIRTVYDRLQPGDILATATDIGGLDVSHSGLVYKGPDGSTGFLHASTTGGVKVSPDLQRYVEKNKRQIGIVVARPIDPRH